MFLFQVPINKAPYLPYMKKSDIYVFSELGCYYNMESEKIFKCF